MPEFATTPPSRTGRGCLFYGCLTCLVVLLITGLLAVFAVRFVRNRIADYTDTAPMRLPRAEMADPELKQLEARVKSFSDAMEKGEPTELLMLTERELNALIENSTNTKALADKFYVSLNGDQVKGQVSLPLPNLGWLGKGRFLNGDATFNVSLENGVLLVTVREVRVKGRPLPESLMAGLRQENLAKDIYKSPENAEGIRKFESLQVQDGLLIIKARAPKP